MDRTTCACKMHIKTLPVGRREPKQHVFECTHKCIASTIVVVLLMCNVYVFVRDVLTHKACGQLVRNLWVSHRGARHKVRCAIARHTHTHTHRTLYYSMRSHMEIIYRGHITTTHHTNLCSLQLPFRPAIANDKKTGTHNSSVLRQQHNRHKNVGVAILIRQRAT